jgi:hypothetical protein
MDLGVYLRVLRRHSKLMFTVLAFGLLLTIYSAFTVSVLPPGLEWKLKPTFQTTSRVLVTEAGFPLGRATLTEPNAPKDASGEPISQFGDPTRFEYLAAIYAELAGSDLIKRQVIGPKGYQRNSVLYLDGGKAVGTYTAYPISLGDGSRPLPLVEIVAQATSPQESNAIAARVLSSLKRYIANRQSNAGIRAQGGVDLEVITGASLAKQIKGRPIVLPMAVFMLSVLGAIALVFFVENFGRRGTARSSPGLESVASEDIDSVRDLPAEQPVASVASLGGRGAGRWASQRPADAGAGKRRPSGSV